MTSRIVILDGATLNPGDNPWTAVEQLGNVTLHADSELDEIIQRLSEADIAITNKVRLTAEIIEQLPNLKFISVSATGHDCVDSAAAAKRGIPVANVPTYGTPSVAQFTFALLLELCHRVALHDEAVRAGEWQSCGSFSFWKTPQIELHGLTLGVIGFGRIGQQVARIGSAFGMRILAASRHRQALSNDLSFEWATTEEIAERADVVSLHCSLNENSTGMINRDFLSRMKPSAFLLNTSRGPLIDEAALAEALNAGELAGAAVDVASVEPITDDNPLLTARNCLITPHMAWSSLAARRRMMEITADNIRHFLAGTPNNIVNSQDSPS
ncbi:MAG: D-2-hydroxyacid dehydrogenase [Planctomycetota bacterium]|nr:D-2-hydroxyacid dehydrogenase [Planctomycetota bacterium]